jgi:hypothetical protein
MRVSDLALAWRGLAELALFCNVEPERAPRALKAGHAAGRLGENQGRADLRGQQETQIDRPKAGQGRVRGRAGQICVGS